MMRRMEGEGWTARAVTAAFAVSVWTVRKWLARYRAEGLVDLDDRSSRARVVANKLPRPWVTMILFQHRQPPMHQLGLRVLRAHPLAGRSLCHWYPPLPAA